MPSHGRMPQAALLTLLLAGCSLVEPEPMDPPAVNPSGISLEAFGLNNQVFQVQLSVYNPNSRPLKVTRGELALEIAGVRVATSRSMEPFTLESATTQEVTIRMVTNLLRDAPAMFRALSAAGEGIEYRIVGYVNVDRRGPDRVPIDIKGELMLPSLGGGPSAAPGTAL